MGRCMSRGALVSIFGLLCAVGCNQEDPLCGLVMHDPAETDPCQETHSQVRVRYSAVTIAPDRLVLAQDDDGDRTWQVYPLGADGFPIGDPAPVLASDLGDVAVWPGPGRSALVTASGAGLEVMLSDTAGLRRVTSGSTPRTQVAAAFDGRVYWLVGETPGAPTPVVQLQITLDGAVSNVTPTLALDPQRSRSALDLASVGGGEIVATWAEHPGLPSGPVVIKAQRMSDGVADGDAWIVAQDAGPECLRGDHKLLVLADGYHVVGRRGPCDGSVAPHLIDLHLDLVARAATERAGAPDAPEIPRAWVVGPPGLLAWDAHTAWQVDPDFGSIDVAWTAPSGEVLRAAAATTSEFVLATETADLNAPHVDLAQLGGPAERVVVAQDRWRDDAGGCGASRSPSLLAGLVVALLLGARRRRRTAAGPPLD